jgi:carotenoid cleavage dioxygenase-like enzyme
MLPAVLTLLAICTLTDSFRTTRTNSLRNVIKFTTTQPLVSSEAETKKIGSASVADLFLDSPEEVITPRKLTPEGSGVPKWLTGTLLRNGPGLFTVQDPSADGSMKSTKLRKFDHVFDGLAKLTRYHFTEDNTLEFSARFIDSTLFKVIT